LRENVWQRKERNWGGGDKVDDLVLEVNGITYFSGYHGILGFMG